MKTIQEIIKLSIILLSIHPDMIRVGGYFEQFNNAGKVTHIKGRLIDRAMILYNYVPYQKGNVSYGKNLLPAVANSFL